MAYPLRNTNCAYTLVEVLVSVTIASLIGMATASAIFYFSQCSISMTNYAILNAADRASLERVGRDLREAQEWVSPLTSNTLSIKLQGQTVTYNSDSTKSQLIRTQGSTSTVVLPHCNQLQFSYYERQTNAATFQDLMVSTSALCRVVKMSWVTTLTNGLLPARFTNSAVFLNRRPL